MPTVQVTCMVPDGVKAAATESVQWALSTPGEVFTIPLVPLPGPASGVAPTAWGCACGAANPGDLYTALTGLPANFPEAAVKVYSPWRTFTAAQFDSWLAGFGLQRATA